MLHERKYKRHRHDDAAGRSNAHLLSSPRQPLTQARYYMSDANVDEGLTPSDIILQYIFLDAMRFARPIESHAHRHVRHHHPPSLQPLSLQRDATSDRLRSSSLLEGRLPGNAE